MYTFFLGQKRQMPHCIHFKLCMAHFLCVALVRWSLLIGIHGESEDVVEDDFEGEDPGWLVSDRRLDIRKTIR